MISDRDIREMVGSLTMITWLIMPDRIRRLPQIEQEQWLADTMREALHVSRETESEKVDE